MNIIALLNKSGLNKTRIGLISVKKAKNKIICINFIL